MKVRFEAESPTAEFDLKEEDSGSFMAETPSPSTNLPTPPSPTSPRGHRRAPSVRLVDGLAHPHSGETSPKKTHSSVRIVDAMGRQIENPPLHDTIKEEEEEEYLEEDSTLLTRDQAIARVRLGLSDLANGLANIQRYGMTNAVSSLLI